MLLNASSYFLPSLFYFTTFPSVLGVGIFLGHEAVLGSESATITGDSNLDTLIACDSCDHRIS